MRPQKREHEKISPDHEFEIVPLPGREFEKYACEKNRNRRKQERDFFREFFARFELLFPKSRDTNADEDEHEREKNSEIDEPEIEE